jgi:hypothetical protein
VATLTRDGLNLHYGFPIVGDYSPQYPDIQARVEAARADPAAWSEVTSRFDNRAALGFYRELSELPPNFLVDSLLLASGLDRRGLKHASFSGQDHNGMLDHINEALPSVLAWFDELHRVK